MCTMKKPVKSEHILIRQEKDMRWYAEENSVSYALCVEERETVKFYITSFHDDSDFEIGDRPSN